MKKRGPFSFVSEWIETVQENVRTIVLESKLPPHIITRSVFIGTVVAMTPTFGLQMPIVGVLWSIFHFSKRLRFNLAIGWTMTWLTNYFTVIPYYFICYYSGAWLGKVIFSIRSPMSYGDFVKLWEPVFQANFIGTLIELVRVFIKIGIPLFIGTLPFILVVPFIIHRITRFSIERYRGMKKKKEEDDPDESRPVNRRIPA